MANFSRVGSANAFDQAVRNIGNRQGELASLQENLTAGKRVLRPSDDPTAAAQAERAMTRLSRVSSDQRALEMQKNAVASAESSLGDAVSTMQSFRELMVTAGNNSLSAVDRKTVTEQLQSLRDELFALANRKDTNGLPLFGGLGSGETPFVGSSGGVTFNGIAGQRASTDTSVAPAFDGAAAFMSVPTGNGVFVVQRNAANTGTAWADAGKVTDPTALTGHGYQLQFNVAGGVTTYDVIDTTLGTPVASAQPYKTGQAITFGGMQMAVSGAPASGDRYTTAPSTRSNLFAVLDAAISDVKSTTGNSGTRATDLARAFMEVDTGMERLQSSRGLAGDLLNRVDRITSGNETRSLQLEADRSRAEDLDMIKGIADFQNQQTGYSAALQSYAQIQKLSLFNFIN